MGSPANKKIIMVAGPNVAGKTTFARAFLPAEAGVPRFINADQIAAGLAAFAPETAAIRAGRLMLEEIALCAERGDNFAFETTLAGLSYLRAIRQWRQQGYRVSLYSSVCQTLNLLLRVWLCELPKVATTCRSH